uniref:Beclin-1-like protein A n=1 Tax=Dermatophagoides pteronyssinus TaxID=6956 RepID=A0A6P6XRU6_DERPT|nr:beclin-1-like protein A [Dermatophagoides pteronyssinus]
MMADPQQQREDYFECHVEQIKLYSLPLQSLKIDSIDFEQCILECIQHRLEDEKNQHNNQGTNQDNNNNNNGLYKRLITELIIKPDNIENTENLVYTAGIYPNRLQWTIKSSSMSLITDDNNHDHDNHHYCIMESKFNQIKLLYVNYNEMPTMIIWLLLSIPKCVKNVTNFCDQQHSNHHPQRMINPSSTTSESSSLFVLVWKCFNEQDVLKLREIYKYLQSLKRMNQTLMMMISNINVDNNNVVDDDRGHRDLSFIDQQQQQQHSTLSKITLNRLNHQQQQQQQQNHYPRCIINNDDDDDENFETTSTMTTKEQSLSLASPSSSFSNTMIISSTNIQSSMNNNKISTTTTTTIDINELNQDKNFSGHPHHHRSLSSPSSSSLTIRPPLPSNTTTATTTLSSSTSDVEQQRIRQRQPPKIIHEPSNVKPTNNVILTKSLLIDKSIINQSKIYNNGYRLNGSKTATTVTTPKQSESEFDTSQINLYLRQKRFPKQRMFQHLRSRSVDSNRHYHHHHYHNKQFNGPDQENIQPISSSTTYTIPLKSTPSTTTTSILKLNKRNNLKMIEKSPATTMIIIFFF